MLKHQVRRLIVQGTLELVSRLSIRVPFLLLVQVVLLVCLNLLLHHLKIAVIRSLSRRAGVRSSHHYLLLRLVNGNVRADALQVLQRSSARPEVLSNVLLRYAAGAEISLNPSLPSVMHFPPSRVLFPYLWDSQVQRSLLEGALLVSVLVLDLLFEQLNVHQVLTIELR